MIIIDKFERLSIRGKIGSPQGNSAHSEKRGSILVLIHFASHHSRGVTS